VRPLARALPFARRGLQAVWAGVPGTVLPLSGGSKSGQAQSELLRKGAHAALAPPTAFQGIRIAPQLMLCAPGPPNAKAHAVSLQAGRSEQTRRQLPLRG